jgi:hypothetical protein
VTAARRSSLITAAAGALLAALWFVPTAHAMSGLVPPAPDARSVAPASAQETGRDSSESAASRGATSGSARSALTSTTPTGSFGSAADGTGTGGHLADTGSVDATPYVFGGTLFLCLGAGFVAYSVRRGRWAAY